MKNFSKNNKRFIALILSAVLCLATSMTVLAAEANNDVSNEEFEVSGSGNMIVPYSVGNCIAADSNVISGYGEITIHLNSSCRKPYLRAVAAGNSNVGVDCYVTLPNGRTEELGTITANGSKTSYLYINDTLPAGDYVFRYYPTSSSTIGVGAFIYSSY